MLANLEWVSSLFVPADWTEAGYEVKLKVTLEPPGAIRPESVFSDYEVIDPKSGDVIHVKEYRFDNKKGQDFKRMPKDNINKLRG